MAQKRVASWFWITTAALAPLALVATVAWIFFTHEVQSNRAEGLQLVQRLETDREQWAPLKAQIDRVATATGFGAVTPEVTQGEINRPTPFSNERNLPPEERSPLFQYYLDAEERYWGEPGYIEDYKGAKKRLDRFEDELTDYIAVKAYQYYTVRTISFGEEGAAVTGDLSRTVDMSDNIPRLPPELINQQRPRYDAGEDPADPSMRPPTRINLELIFRKQFQLIDDLEAVNKHQYALLIADVADQVSIGESTVRIGFEGENATVERIKESTDSLRREIEDAKNSSVTLIEGLERSTTAATEETTAKEVNLDQMVVAATSRIERLQSSFAAERTAHMNDAERYDRMLRNLPRLKNPITLQKADPDGEVTYSDYTRGSIHIDLGSANGVRAGQRFEVWRFHGREDDQMIGVVEIVRTLSGHYSLATVLSLTDDDEPVRKGDKLVSRIWHDGEFLTVALHGTFEPPNEAYTKERLAEMLRQQGMRVVDRVQPGTDLVVLGSRLLGDEWYRDAQNAMRFETISEGDLRLYVDPR